MNNISTLQEGSTTTDTKLTENALDMNQLITIRWEAVREQVQDYMIILIIKKYIIGILFLTQNHWELIQYKGLYGNYIMK